ncbi:MAG: ABC transporter substrate-binding protein [Acetivibrio ethanolgignens]
MKKKFLTLIMAVCMSLTVFTGCGDGKQNEKTTPAPAETVTEASSATQEFADSAGRTVTVPAKIETIAISGPLSQVYILPLAGDMLVGVSNAYSEDAAQYLPAYIFEKTEIGQLYGGKGELDLEALLAVSPDVVIDLGEPKGSIVEDLDALTEQTGIPFIHIDATVATAPEAYRTLGKLLDREEKAEELARWCENTYASMTAMMEKVDADNARKSILYCLGDKGVNVIAQGSFHAETLNLMGNNLAVVEDVVSSGAGNEVDLEQIMVWNPDVIIFAPDSCYADIAAAEEWKSIKAVTEGKYYKTPYGPYGWLSSPPSVQRYLGMLWLGELLYPEYTEYDLQEKITEYYKLFYDCDLTDEMYQALIANALS